MGKEKPQLYSLPLAFEQNQGQAAAAASFLVHRDGVSALFQRDGVVFHLPGQRGSHAGVELTWDASEIDPEGRGLQSGHANYLVGHDAAKWIHNVPLYSAVEYPQLYPGISLLFYGNGDSLEHDFRVDAGADPATITIRFKGADKLELDSRGDLQVHVSSGQLTLRRPVAYQQIEGRKNVDVDFALEKDGTVRFRVGKYDRSYTLVIDPVFTFSTYLAGTGMDQISAVAADSAGNIYATGFTSSADFPLANAVEPECNSGGCPSIFVTKLDPSGHTLLYSTYIGGIGPGGGAGGMAVTSSGTAVITGISSSTNFPQAGSLPYIAQCPNGGSCYYLVSLKPDGSAFNYSGLLQAEQGTYAGTGVVAVDTAGNAYLSAVTDLSSFPITPGTLASSVPGYPYDSTFVLKVDPAGKLLYATIIPGNAPYNPAGVHINMFNPYGLAVDSKGQVTIAGEAGLGLPTTAGVIQKTNPNSAANQPDPVAGFILQLNANASAINFASYLPGTDGAAGMAVDTAGNYYVAGSTGEFTLPVSSNAYLKARPPISCDCFSGYIMKVNPQATAVLAATYLDAPPTAKTAGTGLDAIAIDSHGDVFVDGTTVSPAFPMQNPLTIQLEFANFAADMILAELNPDLSSLLFGSFLNPTDGIYAGSIPAGIALDSTDKLIVGGLTYAVDFPTTENAVQPNLPAPASFLSTPQHSFLAKIDMSIPAPSVCLDTTNVSFGKVPAKTSSSQSVNVTNCGNASLTVASVLSSDPSVAATDDCTDIAPGSACTITLTFTPPTTGAVSGSISIADNAAISPQALGFGGQGSGPQLVTQPTALAFGQLLVGTKSPGLGLLLNNTGTAALTISKISVSGSGYSIAANNCPGILNPDPGGFCSLQIGFSPGAAGAQNGSLVISSNDPVNPNLSVPLTGTGDTTYAAPVITSIGAGTVQINDGPQKITVLGSNFYPASVVQLNGATQQSSFVSNSEVDVTLAAASLTTLGEETLSVTNPGIGSPATAVVTPYAALPDNAVALVSVPATKLLYAAIPVSSTTNPNTVLPIDPATLKTGPPIPVGNDPIYLAAASDGSYLYVANRGDQTVQRINLKTNTVERTFPYSPNPFCTSCLILPASDLEAVPGSPTEVVLAQGGMLSLYNDSGLVNFSPSAFVEYGAPTFSNFTFAGTPPTIYSLPFATVPNAFFETATLDSTGVHWLPDTGPNAVPPSGIGNQVLSDGTLLYTSGGGVWNPSTKAQEGTFPVTYDNTSIALNPATHRYFAIGGYEHYDTQPGYELATILTAYSTQNYKLLGTLAFTDTTPTITGLSVWGTDGFAFLTNPGIWITRTSLMGTQAENPVPTITSISPDSTPAGTQLPNLVISGTGFVLDSYVLWNGKYKSAVQYYSSTSIELSLDNSDVVTPGKATVQVVNPVPGGGSSAVVNYTIGPPIPIAAFLQTILDFGSVAEGETSPSQELFLTNTGSGTLHIASVTASGDYAVTSTCGASLGAYGLCRIFVTFTPTASGTRSGTLSVNDDSGNTPQTVNLTGVGITSFSIGDASGGSTRATVTAGGTASYSLTLSSSGGFTGAVALTCSGAPANSTCTVTPATLNITTDGSSTFKVMVATNVASSSRIASSGGIALRGLAALSLFIIPFVSHGRRSALMSLALLLVISTGLIVACGGGSKSGSSGTTSSGSSAVTPPGTYTLTVKASSGPLTATQALTLTVQ